MGRLDGRGQQADVAAFVEHGLHAQVGQGNAQRRIVQGREDDDLQIGMVFAQIGDQGDAVAELAARHGIVGHEHVAGLPLQQAHQFTGVARQANDVEVSQGIQLVVDAGQDCGVVVGQGDADLHGIFTEDL
ncbi:Uncharacterised protein [Bordetella trematum]|uniref:Uncharacterized protein n=1 Tax=Bordetella trematum TaxID=123899 RepID=A0A157SHB6_9BORD|nr:Uncharacterised protein [Bordetella trematum]